MWETRPFKRLLIFEAPRSQGTGVQFGALAEEHLEPAPKLSRDCLSVPRDVIPSAAVAAPAPARKVLAGAARIPPPPARPGPPSQARQSRSLPTCPSAWAHPALWRPHPGGAARQPARASLSPPASGRPGGFHGSATVRRSASPGSGALPPRRRDPRRLRRRR